MRNRSVIPAKTDIHPSWNLVADSIRAVILKLGRVLQESLDGRGRG